MTCCSHSSIQLVLLDRDGVINEDVGSPGVIDKDQLQLTPNAGHAIGALKRAGLKVALVTNQSCVGKGLIGRDYLMQEIMPTLQQLLLEQDSNAVWDDVFVCTTTTTTTTTADDDTAVVVDPRRKPSPGMIHQACRVLGVEPQKTVMVGDTLGDLQAAQQGGVPLRILVSTGYGAGLVKQSGITSSGTCTDQPLLITQEENTNVQALMHKDHTDCHSQSRLHAVMPFVYTKNLETAVKYILDPFQNASA
jgi:D-glycero-D-manno-heptose 1,7-bisphosphate phosphatase